MIPHIFSKEPIGEIINQDLKLAIAYVKRASTKKQALERAFELIGGRFKGYRFLTYILFWKAFATDPNILWRRSGFMHCTQQNFLLRVLLVKSGWFIEEEIKLGYSLVWYFSPHQFLKIKMNKQMIAADPWNHHFGVPLGYFASGFGYATLNSH